MDSVSMQLIAIVLCEKNNFIQTKRYQNQKELKMVSMVQSINVLILLCKQTQQR
eukprot:m.203411 g.203411  ORF g.203411 m.203411 type:complete len:54 (-) comp13730_c1_seq1:92-253(-)